MFFAKNLEKEAFCLPRRLLCLLMRWIPWYSKPEQLASEKLAWMTDLGSHRDNEARFVGLQRSIVPSFSAFVLAQMIRAHTHFVPLNQEASPPRPGLKEEGSGGECSTDGVRCGVQGQPQSSESLQGFLLGPASWSRRGQVLQLAAAEAHPRSEF